MRTNGVLRITIPKLEPRSHTVIQFGTVASGSFMMNRLLERQPQLYRNPTVRRRRLRGNLAEVRIRGIRAGAAHL